ncbi:polysaccharide deacetylase family sporulation protein PdaB [Virgibacillus siamensis]|uniref:polysaccharide deacetylase family sporulation protein PdaB n=1 Tax=Virgibacillus siamensis TaxID=480071 RepID=UPI0009866995|nr:polysaccharide deacetylase family sporulation protein PdaB [Virgibacillus siamensis]
MDHFYVMRINKWKRWLVVVAFAFFAALLLWFESMGSLAVFSKGEPAAFTRGNPDQSNIALTFNISWGEEKVHDILKMLKKHNVQATFFVSGEWAERHPEILKKITKGKHELGMLGYRYESYLDMELEQVGKDLRHAREVFNKLGYEDMELLRPPSGHFNKEIIKLAEEMDYKVVHWNVSPHDWENPGTQQIINFVMEKTKNGDIILMHASDSVKQTGKALKTILPGLKKKGFQFVSVSELINQAHAEAKIVE